MLTTLATPDDRNRGKRGIVLSVGRTIDGRLKLTKDEVRADKQTAPNDWKFRSFQNHFVLDEKFLKDAIAAVKNGEKLDVPEDVFMELGRIVLAEVVSQYQYEADGR